ncbi:MAG TPA: hypothetical protein VHS78_01010 [Candidatus Elarobacter sp.]|nr:hypothetical protein [Candidatus Elarobacter sp.]
MPSTGPGVRADTRTELYHAIPDDRTAALPGSAPSPYPPPPPAYAPPPGYYPQPIYVTQQVQMAPAYVAVAAPKSMAAALLLTFFFGPLGLFYASVAGGIVMLIVSVLLAMVTFGLSLFVTVPACMVWAAIATSNYNARLAGPPQYSQNVR